MQPAVFRSHAEDEYFFIEGCHILEMLNDDSDPGVSIVRARVTPGETTDWHRLQGTVERYVILQGRGEAFVGGDEAWPVRAGDVVLIPPMVPQRIRNTGPDDLLFLAICTPRFEARNYLPEKA